MDDWASFRIALETFAQTFVNHVLRLTLTLFLTLGKSGVRDLRSVQSDELRQI